MKVEEEKGGRRRCVVERKVEMFDFSHQEFWRRQAPPAPLLAGVCRPSDSLQFAHRCKSASSINTRNPLKG